MDRPDVHHFLRLLGAADITDSSAGWLNCRCLLAEFRHANGKDSRPSFGVSISPDKESVFYCFGCSERPASLRRLLYTIFVSSGKYPWEAARWLGRKEAAPNDLIADKAPVSWEDKIPYCPDPLPPRILRKFPFLQYGKDSVAEEIRRWLEEDRGVPRWIQYMFRLRYDCGRKAVVFPMTDPDGRAFLLRERRVRTKDIWTVSAKMMGEPEGSFPKLRDAGVWFGMHLIDWSRPVILVEGEIDCMRMASLGAFNTIASCTASVTKVQIDAVHSDRIILGYDRDAAGEKAQGRVRKLIGARAMVQSINWSIVGRKDGGDLKDKTMLYRVLSRLE